MRTAGGRLGAFEKVEDVGGLERGLFVIAQGIRGRRRGGTTRRSIYDGQRVLSVGCILDVSSVGNRRIAVAVGRVILVLLTLWLLLFVELALVFLVLRDTSLQAKGISAVLQKKTR